MTGGDAIISRAATAGSDNLDAATPPQPAEPFCKLADPSAYVACNWDMCVDDTARAYWIGFFKRHIQTVLELGVAAAVKRGGEAGAAAARADACRAEFVSQFDAFCADPLARTPGQPERVTILTLDQWRDQILRRHGFVDCFIDLKERENQAAIPFLPAVCREIDAMDADPQQQARAVIEGVFAGNIFDMGAEATAKQFLAGGPDFFTTRSRLQPRPWRVDQFDAFADRLAGVGWRRVVFFIDNAGSDFLLGAVPMMRWLARRGASVVLAANERPTLNDMTIHDVNRWWPRIIEVEPSIADLPIERVSTGTGEPLIDLSHVAPGLNAASRDADLVILEGMGRGVESNLDAKFSCDALNLAMLKDPLIADRLGGALYDCVCRFR